VQIAESHLGGFRSRRLVCLQLLATLPIWSTLPPRVLSSSVSIGSCHHLIGNMSLTQLPSSGFAQCCLLWLVSLFHIIFAPFTKVEESFSMQAIHDCIFLSKVPLLQTADLSNNSSPPLWDHESFPGVAISTIVVY